MTLARAPRRETAAVYLKSAVGLFLMFGFGYLPPLAPLTPMGMKVAGIFLGLVFLLCTVSIVWPSMLSVVALGMSGYCTVPEAIAGGLGSEMVWMMLVMLILSEAMAKSGMGEIIARWIITRDFLNHRPVLFTFIYLWGFGLCSLLVGSIVVVLMSWSIFYSIAELAGYKKGEKYSTMMLIGCFLSAISFEGLLAFQSWLLGLSRTYQSLTGLGINYVQYFFIGLVILTLFILLMVLSMKHLFRCDFDKLNRIDVAALKKSELGGLTFRHKFFLSCFALIISYVFATTIFPADWALIRLLSSITQSGWFAFVLCLPMIVRHEGRPVLDFIETAKTGANWNILMMCVAIMPIAGALTSEGTGMKQLITRLLAPLIGHMGPAAFLGLVMAAMLLLANVGSNMAAGVIMLNVALPFAGSCGCSPAVVGMAIIFLASLGFLLPGSSGMAPFLHSNDWIEAKSIYKYGGFDALLLLLCAVPVFLLVSLLM